MKVTISQPQTEDQTEIHALFSTVITQTFKDQGIYDEYKQDIPYEVKQQTTALQEALNKTPATHFLIAKDGSKIVGTIAYGKPNEEIRHFYKHSQESIPEIKSVYILPTYQGKGIGTMLFNEVMSILRQNNYTEFYLDSGYPRAQQFWKKELGEPVVRIVDRWGAGNDYLIWHGNINTLQVS